VPADTQAAERDTYAGHVSRHAVRADMEAVHVSDHGAARDTVAAPVSERRQAADTDGLRVSRGEERADTDASIGHLERREAGAHVVLHVEAWARARLHAQPAHVL